MRIAIFAAMAAVFCGASGAAMAACAPAHGRNCLNLDTVSTVPPVLAIGQQPLPSKAVPAAEDKPAYTGPTVGVSRTVHRTPTVGYRWAID